MRSDEGLKRIGPEKEGSGSFCVARNPMVATEFACVLGREETGVVRLTVAELGFPRGTTRASVFKAARERGFCGLNGYACVKMAQTLRARDGIVHLVWIVEAQPGLECGHVVKWDNGSLVYDIDRADPFEHMPAERTLIFAVQAPKRPTR